MIVMCSGWWQETGIFRASRTNIHEFEEQYMGKVLHFGELVLIAEFSKNFN